MRLLGNINGNKVYGCTYNEYINSFFIIEDERKVIQNGYEVGYTDGSMGQIYWKKKEETTAMTTTTPAATTQSQQASYFAQFSGVVDKFFKNMDNK